MKFKKPKTYQMQCLGLHIRLTSDNPVTFFATATLTAVLNTTLMYLAVLITIATANRLLPVIWPGYPQVGFLPALLFVVVADTLISGTYWLVLLTAQVATIALYMLHQT